MIYSGGPVRIVADDLTGALDAAAPFASSDHPVGLVLDAKQLPDRLNLTISTDSRDSSPDEAAAATVRACNVLRQAHPGIPALWFHKVDSVLRGQPFAATAAMMKRLGLERCLFAPAFPAMGRITRGGQHLVLTGADWRPVAKADIMQGLRSAGLTPASEDRSLFDRTNAIVVDAETQGDLDRAAARHVDPRILWVGSRALAESLVGHVSPVLCPPFAIVLVGTAHPITRAQVAFAATRFAMAPVTGPIKPAADECVLIDPVSESADPDLTQVAVIQAVRRMDPDGFKGRSLFVTGGETLSIVLNAAEARSVDCIGEVAPGLPISAVRGGRLDGIMIVTKSGGFGTPDLLIRNC